MLMKRILIFGMTENPGGVESFLMNYYRFMDRSRLQFDFLCNTLVPAACEDEILSLGGEVFHITARSENMARFAKELQAFFTDRAAMYDVIWINVSSLANIDYLIYAKKHGIRRRIIHSHNAANMDSVLRGVLHRINRLRIGETATDFWACSEEAADWFYKGKPRKRARIIHNAIDPEKYAFCAEKRRRIRESLGWSGKFLIGNTGRLHFQKNQRFMLELMKMLIKRNRDFRMVLVGDGEDRNSLQAFIRANGLQDYVRLAGVQSDIQAWLSAFDLFLFPSLFEGASVSLIEAQANGIPILASDTAVIPEVHINDNLHVLSLRTKAEDWAGKIRRLAQTGEGRLSQETAALNIERSGYDIHREAEKLFREIMK